MKTKTFLTVILFIVLSSLVYGQTTESSNYEISFSMVPRCGGGKDSTDIISGKATGSDVSNLKIVIYAKGGDTWWVQPTVENPYTKVSPSGQWQNVIHLGSVYAALLVLPTFKPVSYMTSIPQLEDGVVAIVFVNCPKK